MPLIEEIEPERRGHVADLHVDDEQNPEPTRVKAQAGSGGLGVCPAIQSLNCIQPIEVQYNPSPSNEAGSRSANGRTTSCKELLRNDFLSPPHPPLSPFGKRGSRYSL